MQAVIARRNMRMASSALPWRADPLIYEAALPLLI